MGIGVKLLTSLLENYKICDLNEFIQLTQKILNWQPLPQMLVKESFTHVKLTCPKQKYILSSSC